MTTAIGRIATKLYFPLAATRRVTSLRVLFGNNALFASLMTFRWLFPFLYFAPAVVLMMVFPVAGPPVVLVLGVIQMSLPRLRRQLLAVTIAADRPARTCLWLRPFIREGVEMLPDFMPETLIRLALAQEYALVALTDKERAGTLPGFEPKITDDDAWFSTFEAEAERADIILIIPEATGATAIEVAYLAERRHHHRVFWIQLPDHVASAGKHRGVDADLYRMFWIELQEKFLAHNVEIPAFLPQGQVFVISSNGRCRHKMLGNDIDCAAFNLRSFVWWNTPAKRAGTR